jgi:hypothetical protein
MFLVPAGVTMLHVVAVGGAGASILAPGGEGAAVTADLPVTPGQMLYLEVGQNGADGGFNGGAGGGGGCCAFPSDGGRGGGATDIRTTPRAQPGSLASRLLVAAGGGGAGAYGSGNGGAAESAGQDGDAAGIGGGTAGTLFSGGAAGAGAYGGSAGQAGALASGGSGGDAGTSGGGGGGGGGYFGGGGGGGGGAQPLSVGGGGTGAGGGGGSSFVIPQASSVIATDATGVPTVAISYPLPSAQASPGAIAFAAQPQGSVSAPQTITVSNTGAAPLLLSGVTLAGADSDDFIVSEDGCLGPLAETASCDLLVRFAPTATGPRSATLSVASNDPASPASVSLSGIASALLPGPQGQSGASGAPGPAGASSVASPEEGLKVRLVTCRVGRRDGKRCVSRLVISTHAFQFPAGASASMVRRGQTYAAGDVGKNGQLVLHPTQAKVPAGAYTLQLVSGSTEKLVRVTL